MACLAPDGKFWLFRRKNKIWSNKKVHPDYRIFGKKGKEFKNSIDHMMSKNLFELICRFNRNTSLHAEDLFEQEANLKKSFSIRKILSRFIKCFFLRKGYKNGGIGLLVAILCSFYPYVAALKAKWLENIKR